MRIFITGNRGQLGSELMRALASHDVAGGDLPEFDIRDADLTHRLIVEHHSDIVIHTAALTDTRLCETDPDLAHAVNVEGTRNIALACREAGAALVYVSTNEVFDGTKGTPYVESDEPHAINVYGRSKLEGEQAALSTLHRCYIVRTAWLYGAGRDFPAKILAAAEQHTELMLVTDEVATPTLAADLASAIAQLIQHSEYGIYHFTNAGECSRYDWAREVLRLAGRDDVVLKPTTLAEFKPFPSKPPYTALANTAGDCLGITLRPWQEALAAHFAS